jgi:hypothetical protein
LPTGQPSGIARKTNGPNLASRLCPYLTRVLNRRMDQSTPQQVNSSLVQLIQPSRVRNRPSHPQYHDSIQP